MKKIIVRICENDNYGNQTGLVARIAFDGIVILESDYFNGGDGGEKITHLVSPKGYTRLRLNGKTYLYFNKQTGIGSKAWNGYLMDTITAVELFNDLVKSGEWTFSSIYTELDDILERYSYLFQSDFEAIFCDSLL